MRQTLSARAKAPAFDYDYSLLNGKFQIVTENHLAQAKVAAQTARNPIINIGSIDQSRNTFQPFSYGERERMWRAALNELGDDAGRFRIMGTRDVGNRLRWADNVQAAVDSIIRMDGLDPQDQRIALIGHRKDTSSFYLDDFPGYDLIDGGRLNGADASHLRDSLFTIGDTPYVERWLQTAPPSWCVDTLVDFIDSPEFDRLVAEDRSNKDEAAKWAGSPYPPIFNTADSLIVQGNHILLIRRRRHPGKGLWALPGGFLKHRETVIDAALRENTEETRFPLSKAAMRDYYVDTFYEDNPWRSTRGRLITFVSIFHLRPKPVGKTPEERRRSMRLPVVRHRDDAIDARWFTFDQVQRMRDQLHEDHAVLIDKGLERLGIRYQ